MGTRSRIGVMHGTVCKSVYCHWDGYLEHNGKILQEHYDSAKANNLVALGDISSLGTKIGEQHPFSPHFDEGSKAAFDAAQNAGWTTFYGRDRGEKNVDFAVDHTFEDFMKRVDGCGAEYYYIMKDGVWYVGDNYGVTYMSGTLVPLAEALYKDEPDSEIQADLNETLGLDRNTSMEDLVAHIAELDGEAA